MLVGWDNNLDGAQDQQGIAPKDLLLARLLKSKKFRHSLLADFVIRTLSFL